MTQHHTVHPAAEALSLELDEWDQYPEDSGWYFTTVGGRLCAEQYHRDGSVIATYSVDLADIPFTQDKEHRPWLV